MNPTIGEELQAVRAKKKITLEEAASATHIRLAHLQNLEENRFSELPSRTQARGFLRLYGAFLGLDVQSLLDRYDPPQESIHIPVIPENGKPKISKKRAPGFVKSIPEPIIPIEPEHKSIGDPAIPIFAEIGQTLQNQREKLSLALEDISAHTHIRMAYLQALEAGQFDKLPSPMQVRGLLNNYAEFLSLDSDPLLARYANALQTRRGETGSPSGEKSEKPPEVKKSRFAAIRQFLTADLIIGIFLIFVLFGFIIWGASQLLNSKTQSVTPSAPPISEVLLTTPSFEPTEVVTGEGSETSQLTLATEQATEQAPETTLSTSPTVVVSSSSSLHLNITINQPAFLRVYEDGKERFNGRVIAGNAYQFNANQTIELLTGNAAALEVVFNQTNLGIMGNFGQKLHLIFSARGILTPTPAFTSTPTAPPPATLTPRPTPTVPTPTVTPLIPTP
jgi:cytoskeletal protein RodZ